MSTTRHTITYPLTKHCAISLCITQLPKMLKHTSKMFALSLCMAANSGFTHPISWNFNIFHWSLGHSISFLSTTRIFSSLRVSWGFFSEAIALSKMRSSAILLAEHFQHGKCSRFSVTAQMGKTWRTGVVTSYHVVVLFLCGNNQRSSNNGHRTCMLYLKK